MPSKTKHEITIRSAAAEYLTFVSTTGDQPGSVELRYEDENIWLTQRLMGSCMDFNQLIHITLLLFATTILTFSMQ